MVRNKEIDEMIGYIRPVNIRNFGAHEPEVYARYRRGVNSGISIDGITENGNAYNPTREEVRWLRLDGKGIDEIAERTGISREQAETYCRQLGLPLEGSCGICVNGTELEKPQVLKCKNCGDPLPAKRRMFCSDSCKEAYRYQNRKGKIKTGSNPPASGDRSISKPAKAGTAHILEFKKNIEERKPLVKKLEELTGERSVYTRAPEYAFLIGSYKVDRAGNLLVEEEKADWVILDALISEGMITQAGSEESGESTREKIAAETAERREPVKGYKPEEGTEAPVHSEKWKAEKKAEASQSFEKARKLEEITKELGSPDAQSFMEESDTLESSMQQELGEKRAEAPISELENLNMLRITFPMKEHTGLSLRNLVFLLHSRAELINKAIGSHFHVDDGLVETLKDDICTFSTLNFRKVVERYEDKHGQSMEGLIITPEEIAFTGFAVGMDADHYKACTDLATAMNKMSIEQKRVQPTVKPVENEKYSLRIWLVRMGMGGDDYWLTRKLLMENLSGHTAYRTPEEKERARNKAKRLREERKAKAAASAAESDDFEG